MYGIYFWHKNILYCAGVEVYLFTVYLMMPFVFLRSIEWESDIE